MRRLRPKLTYANVMVTILAFIVLGAGGAYAASQLGKNTVGTKQLKKSAVTTEKLKKKAVTAAKVKDGTLTGNQLADGTITGAKVQDGSLSNADLNQSLLTSLRLPNLIGLAMNSDCTAAVPFPSGVITEQVGTACKVIFTTNILNCAAIATVGYRTDSLIITSERTVQTLRRPSTPNQIVTSTRANGSLVAQPVDLVMVC